MLIPRTSCRPLHDSRGRARSRRARLRVRGCRAPIPISTSPFSARAQMSSPRRTRQRRGTARRTGGGCDRQPAWSSGDDRDGRRRLGARALRSRRARTRPCDPWTTSYRPTLHSTWATRRRRSQIAAAEWSASTRPSPGLAPAWPFPSTGRLDQITAALMREGRFRRAYIGIGAAGEAPARAARRRRRPQSLSRVMIGQVRRHLAGELRADFSSISIPTRSRLQRRYSRF